jgi:hypothetical protein
MQGGIFLRKMPLEYIASGIQLFWNRYTVRVLDGGLFHGSFYKIKNPFHALKFRCLAVSNPQQTLAHTLK